MSRSEFSNIQEMSFSQGETEPAVPMAREGLRKTFTLMDVEGMIVYVDPVMALRFGSDPQSLPGKHISSLIPGERLGALVRKVAKTGIPQKVSGSWLPSGSSAGPGRSEHHLLPITTDSGKVTGVVFCRVARPSGDPALKTDRSGKKFKTLFDSISIPILIVHKNGTVLDCNRSACEYLGIDGDDLPGMTLYDLVRAGWSPITAAGINDAGMSGRSRFEVPLRGKPEENGISEISLRMVEYGNATAFLAEIREAPVSPAASAEREQSLRELKAGLKSLSEEVTLAEERERLRIAADIHDGVSQILAAAHFQLEELEAGMLPGEARALAGRIREHVMRAIHSARSLSFELCPPVLRERGLEAAAEWLLGHFQKDYGISPSFSSDGKVDRLEWHLEVLLFKMLRELLQNVGKHARAKRVQVFLRNVDGRVQVTVEDDGIGFDPSKIRPTEREGGFGLHSIRERLRYVGGECAIESALYQGTRCTVNIPIGNGRQP